MMTSRRSLFVQSSSFSLALVVAVACGGEPKPADVPTPATPAPATKTVQDPKPSGLPQAETLLAEAAEAMGGAKFGELKSFYAESQLDMGGLGLKGVARTWWREGDFYNESQIAGVGTMRIGAAKGQVWGDDPISGLRHLSGKEAEQALWSSATLCLPHDWRRFFTRVETRGVKTVEGQQVAEVVLFSALGDEVVLVIDMTTKLPVSQSFVQASPLGSMPATVQYKDYRVVDGLKIPYQQVLVTSLTQAVSTTTKLELNVEVEPEKFAMPGAATAVTPGSPADVTALPPPAPSPAPPTDPAPVAANK